MHLNIKERCQKVLQSLSMNAQPSIREIAAATGIPKSSVHRHLGALRRRQQHPESSLWETPEGGEWLRLLVFGVIYCFGIKGCIGSDSLSEFFHLLRLALWICAKFQRTSSAVESRNGYLSRLHHAHRGFTDQRLQVLTIIHNFDLKRHDGSTAAQRLFGKSFPILFDAVVANLGDLPRPRRTLKTPKSQKTTVQTVPA